MKGSVRGAAISISGMKESPVEYYFLTDIEVDARSREIFSFAKGWKFKNVSLKTKDNNTLKVQNSSDMDCITTQDTQREVHCTWHQRTSYTK